MRNFALTVILLAFGGLTLAGCGMCTDETLGESLSPGGMYSVSIVSSDCVGTSRTMQVVLHNLDGMFKDSKAVAIFDDSDGDDPADVSAKWQLDDKLIIQGHGARVWSFEPNWHKVQVEER